MSILIIKELKEIIMNLDDDYKVYMEEQDEKIDTVPIKGVEISIDTKEIILKNW
jgi:hypothetical protein